MTSLECSQKHLYRYATYTYIHIQQHAYINTHIILVYTYITTYYETKLGQINHMLKLTEISSRILEFSQKVIFYFYENYKNKILKY